MSYKAVSWQVSRASPAVWAEQGSALAGLQAALGSQPGSTLSSAMAAHQEQGVSQKRGNTPKCGAGDVRS